MENCTVSNPSTTAIVTGKIGIFLGHCPKILMLWQDHSSYDYGSGKQVYWQTPLVFGFGYDNNPTFNHGEPATRFQMNQHWDCCEVPETSRGVRNGRMGVGLDNEWLGKRCDKRIGIVSCQVCESIPCDICGKLTPKNELKDSGPSRKHSGYCQGCAECFANYQAKAKSFHERMMGR